MDTEETNNDLTGYNQPLVKLYSSLDDCGYILLIGAIFIIISVMLNDILVAKQVIAQIQESEEMFQDYTLILVHAITLLIGIFLCGYAILKMIYQASAALILKKK